MPQDEYKIVIRKDTTDLKKLEAELERSRKKETESEKQTTAIIKANLKEKYANLQANLNKQMEAIRQGNKLEIKEAIESRKIIESDLRVYEATYRNILSKELAAFQTNEKAKILASRQTLTQLNNAPKTKLSGAIGSESYVRQLQSAQTKFMPGSNEFMQTGVLIEKYKSSLKSAGVEVQSLSQKIGGQFNTALSTHRKELGMAIQNYLGLGAGVAGATILLSKLWDLSLASKQFEVLRSHFKGTTQDLEDLKTASANTVSEASLIQMSNQATDLGVSLKQQTILMSVAEDVVDSYGGTVEEKFMAMINSSEGLAKALKVVGVQKKVYEATLKELIKSQGWEQDNLTAEQDKWARVTTLVKLSGVTYEDAKNKIGDVADQQEAMSIGLGDLITKYGWGLVKGILPFLKGIEQVGGAIVVAKNQFPHLRSELIGFQNDLVNATANFLGFADVLSTPIDIDIRVPENAFSILKSMGNVNQGIGVTELERIAMNQGKAKDKPKKNKGSKTHKEEVDAIQELIDKIKFGIEYAKEFKNLTYGMTVEYENELKTALALAANDKDRLRIQKEINEVLQIRSELEAKTSQSVASEVNSLLLLANSTIRGNTKALLGLKTDTVGQANHNISANSQPADEHQFNKELSKILDGFGMMRTLTGEMESIFGQLPDEAKQIFNEFDAIISLIKTLNELSSALGFLDFIPGGGIAKAVIAHAAGGMNRSIAPDSFSGGSKSMIHNTIYLSTETDILKFAQNMEKGNATLEVINTGRLH